VSGEAIDEVILAAMGLISNDNDIAAVG